MDCRIFYILSPSNTDPMQQLQLLIRCLTGKLTSIPVCEIQIKALQEKAKENKRG
jgi:hypothetical protein